MKKSLRDNWGSLFIIIALVLLAVFLFRDPAVFPHLASYGLLVVTAVYAWATVRIAGENKRTIEEMKQSRLDAVRPYLLLQPGDFALNGSFSGLYLINSGGIARDVKIDVEIAQPKTTELLFAPAIEREHWVFLGLIGKAQNQTVAITVRLEFKDGYDHPYNDSLSINLADLRKEGRKVIGRYSELVQIKQTLESLISEIRRKNM